MSNENDDTHEGGWSQTAGTVGSEIELQPGIWYDSLTWNDNKKWDESAVWGTTDKDA